MQQEHFLLALTGKTTLTQFFEDDDDDGDDYDVEEEEYDREDSADTKLHKNWS